MNPALSHCYSPNKYDFLVKNALGPFFHFKLSKFSFCLLKAPLLGPCHAQSMNIFGQYTLQTDNQSKFKVNIDSLLLTLMLLDLLNAN